MNPPIKRVRINQQIRSPRLLVIDEDGQRVGELSLEEALKLAEERELDLIEIAPMGNPPVAKILDYGKFKYEQSKAEQRQRKSAKPIVVKEVRLGLKIQEHDMEVKRERARQFLAKGYKVKVSLMLKGREVVRADLGMQIMEKFYEPLASKTELDQKPVKQGRSLLMTIRPK